MTYNIYRNIFASTAKYLSITIYVSSISFCNLFNKFWETPFKLSFSKIEDIFYNTKSSTIKIPPQTEKRA